MLTTDNELLGKYLVTGDGAAFEELVRRHSPMVFGVCKNLLFNTQDAEDAFQATFLVLSMKANSLVGQGSIAGWLYAVAVRNCFRIRRKRARSRETEMIEDLPSLKDNEPWMTISHAQESDLIHQEINRLPARYRDVIVLCHLEGYSRLQAAEFLDGTEAGIKAALSRARNLLRRRLIRRGIITTTLLGVMAGTSTAAKASIKSELIDATLQLCNGVTPTIPVGTTPQIVKSIANQGTTGMVSSSIKLVAYSVTAIALIAMPIVLVAQGLADKPVQETIVLNTSNDRSDSDSSTSDDDASPTVEVQKGDLARAPVPGSANEGGAKAVDIGIRISDDPATWPDRFKNTAAVESVNEGVKEQVSRADVGEDRFDIKNSEEYWSYMVQSWQLRIAGLKKKAAQSEEKELVLSEMYEANAKLVEAMLNLKRIKSQPAVKNVDDNSVDHSATNSSGDDTPLPQAASALLASTAPVTIGEELTIEVLDDPSLSRIVVVTSDGMIGMPLVGAVYVKGKTLTEIKTLLDEKLEEFLKKPDVFVARRSSSRPLLTRER